MMAYITKKAVDDLYKNLKGKKGIYRVGYSFNTKGGSFCLHSVQDSLGTGILDLGVTERYLKDGKFIVTKKEMVDQLYNYYNTEIHKVVGVKDFVLLTDDRIKDDLGNVLYRMKYIRDYEGPRYSYKYKQGDLGGYISNYDIVNGDSYIDFNVVINSASKVVNSILRNVEVVNSQVVNSELVRSKVLFSSVEYCNTIDSVKVINSTVKYAGMMSNGTMVEVKDSHLVGRGNDEFISMTNSNIYESTVGGKCGINSSNIKGSTIKDTIVQSSNINNVKANNSEIDSIDLTNKVLDRDKVADTSKIHYRRPVGSN